MNYTYEEAQKFVHSELLKLGLDEEKAKSGAGSIVSKRYRETSIDLFDCQDQTLEEFLQYIQEQIKEKVPDTSRAEIGYIDESSLTIDVEIAYVAETLAKRASDYVEALKQSEIDQKARNRQHAESQKLRRLQEINSQLSPLRLKELEAEQQKLMKDVGHLLTK